jgi:hypothetical protein
MNESLNLLSEHMNKQAIGLNSRLANLLLPAVGMAQTTVTGLGPNAVPSVTRGMGLSLKDFLLHRALPAAGLAGAGVAVPMGISAGVGAIKDAIKNNKIDRSYDNMYNENKNLAQLKIEGREEDIKKRFEILRAYAPDMAINPLVASTFVENSLQQGDLVHPQALDPLVNIMYSPGPFEDVIRRERA